MIPVSQRHSFRDVSTTGIINVMTAFDELCGFPRKGGGEPVIYFKILTQKFAGEKGKLMDCLCHG